MKVLAHVSLLFLVTLDIWRPHTYSSSTLSMRKYIDRDVDTYLFIDTLQLLLSDFMSSNSTMLLRGYSSLVLWPGLMSGT